MMLEYPTVVNTSLKLLAVVGAGDCQQCQAFELAHAFSPYFTRTNKE